MSTHSLCHAVKIQSDHPTVREALTTAKGLEAWTAAKVSGGKEAGGKWTFQHEEGPTFVWAIEQESADTVSWKCVEGPGDAVGKTATFQLAKESDGRIHLTLEHDGWTHEKGNFAKCNSLWGKILHQLRDYAEKDGSH